MPLIQNRKSKVEEFVTTDDWIDMQKSGMAGRFTVVDDKDLQETVIKKPEIFETIEEILPDREGMKKFLDEREVEYNPRWSTDKIQELYLQAIKQ